MKFFLSFVFYCIALIGCVLCETNDIDQSQFVDNIFVCKRVERIKELVLKKYYYDCCKSYYCSCGRGKRSEWFQNQFGLNNKCICYSKGTCEGVRKVCQTRNIEIKFCCVGYEPDGKGGCKSVSSIQCKHCQQLCKGGGTPTKAVECGCFNGYKLMNKTHCTDIDECSPDSISNPCNQKCNNFDGGFYCSCNLGYDLINSTYCEETDECAENNGGCQHKCVNRPGLFYCTCNKGYSLTKGVMCEDIDECNLLEGANGGCSHECTNTDGSYECSCPNNYVLQANNKTCLPQISEPDVGFNKGKPKGLSKHALFGIIISSAILGILLLVLFAWILYKVGCCSCCCTGIVAPTVVETGRGNDNHNVYPVLSSIPIKDKKSEAYGDDEYVEPKKDKESGEYFNEGFQDIQNQPPNYSEVMNEIKQNQSNKNAYLVFSKNNEEAIYSNVQSSSGASTNENIYENSANA